MAWTGAAVCWITLAFFLDDPLATEVVSLQLEVAAVGVVDAVVTGAVAVGGAADAVPLPLNRFLKNPPTVLETPAVWDASVSGVPPPSTGTAVRIGVAMLGAVGLACAATVADTGIGAGIATGSVAAITAGAERC